MRVHADQIGGDAICPVLKSDILLLDEGKLNFPLLLKRPQI